MTETATVWVRKLGLCSTSQIFPRRTLDHHKAKRLELKARVVFFRCTILLLNQQMSCITLRELKLSMCDVHKSKSFTVRSGNTEMILSIFWIFNPVEVEKKKLLKIIIIIHASQSTTDSPFQLCISHQHLSIAFSFAMLRQRKPGEHFRVALQEFGEKRRVWARVSSLFQVFQEDLTAFRRVCADELVYVRGFCEWTKYQTKMHCNKWLLEQTQHPKTVLRSKQNKKTD